MLKTINLNDSTLISIADIENAITKKHEGKMEDMYSLSTSIIPGHSNKYGVDVEGNIHCLNRIKCKGLVCNKCYADALAKQRKALAQKLIDNTVLLTTVILPMELIPYLNTSLFRLESFADLRNVIQVINYFQFCYKNPHVNFALWSKNPWLIKQALELGYEKPKNLQIVYSSCKLNECEENIFNLYPFIDRVFTVYTAEYAIEHNIDINCGYKKCKNCQECYHASGKKFINEMLKQEYKKYCKLYLKKYGKAFIEG